MSGPRGYGASGWKGGNMTIGPFDRVSHTMNGMAPSGSDVDDFGRRSYSAQGGARRGRRSEAGGDNGPYSAQDAWLSQQGLGDSSRYGGSEGFRGRDMGGRHDMGGYGDEDPHSRAGSFSEGVSGHMGQMAGSASAPISPVKSSSGLHNEPRMYSGTWSTGPSPRQGQRGLPNVNGPRLSGNAGPGNRRPSDSVGRRQGPSTQQPRGPGYGSDYPQTAGSADRYAGSGYGGPQQHLQPLQVPGKRAYSVGAGPSTHAYPQTMTPGNVSPSELAMVNGGASNAAFQPFTSPAGGSVALASNGHSGGPGGYPSTFQSPDQGPLKALPGTAPFPAYQAEQGEQDSSRRSGDKDQLAALDELTSRVGQVALGLEDGAEPKSKQNGNDRTDT